MQCETELFFFFSSFSRIFSSCRFFSASSCSLTFLAFCSASRIILSVSSCVTTEPTFPLMPFSLPAASLALSSQSTTHHIISHHIVMECHGGERRWETQNEEIEEEEGRAYAVLASCSARDWSTRWLTFMPSATACSILSYVSPTSCAFFDCRIAFKMQKHRDERRKERMNE